MLSLFTSTKTLSLISMMMMIAIDPSNALKISFSHFAFNLIMSVLAYFLPPYTVALVEASLPFKGTTVGVAFFMFFKTVPDWLLGGYDFIVMVVGPAYMLFEACQVINLLFATSRALQQRLGQGSPARG